MMLLVYIVVLGITGNLAVNGQPYGPWSDWSECTVDEGQGVMRRTRECIVDVCPEPGEYLDFMACFVITKPCECECPPFPAAPGTDEPSTVSTGTIKIELSEEPTTIEANVTEAPGQEVSTSTIQIELSEEPTTAAPEATTAAVENATTPSEEEVTTEVIDIGLIEETTTAAPESNTTSAPESSTTSAPEISTTSAPESNATSAPEITSTSAPETGISTTSASELNTTNAPEITTTGAPEISTTSAPEINTTNAPELSTTSAPEINATNAPEITSTSASKSNTTNSKSINNMIPFIFYFILILCYCLYHIFCALTFLAPELSTTSAPEITTSNELEITTTSAPEINATNAPELTSTSAPEITTSSAPAIASTSAPEINATSAPEVSTTSAPENTTTNAPEESTTSAPEISTTSAPEINSTSVPEITTTSVPEISTTSEENSTGTTQLETNPAVTEETEPAIGAIKPTTETPAEIPCEDNALGAAVDGTLPSSSFTASSSFGEFVPSYGRLNGPLAWCSEGDSAGQEYLQIHVPEAEVICAIAIQGTGYERGHEYVRDYYIEYSEDGIGWQVYEEDGNLKVFKGNDDSKSTSKQVLPVPVEATYIRIYPMQYEGWICMRAELYGKGITQQAPFPTVPEETTAAPSEETTAAPPATEETTTGPSEETTAASPATEETTASPSEETTATPTTTEESTAAPSEEPTASPAATEESTAAQSEETTAAPTEESTAAPSEETTSAPPEETTAAPSEETTAASPGPESEQPTTVQEEASTPPPPVTPPIPTTPKRRGMDIGILIDSSFGVAADGRDASFRRREFGVYETITFDRLKSFVSELVISINEHFEDVNFGIIVYSDIPELVMTLQDAERVDVPSVIDGIRYIPGGHRTDLAMLYASRKLFCPEGCDDRPDEDNVMIVFTSENTDAESLPYSFVSPIMKNCTSNIIAVGISNEVSKSELVKIALGSKERVLKVVSPDDLDAGIINQIEEMIAEGPIVPTTQGAIAEEEEEPTTGGLVHFRT
ncbi:uncharacterized protein LOC144656916 isoform X4 [Oculina patagonica]